MAATLGLDAALWSRLSPLLDAALDLPAAERTAWLAALPADSADLRPALQRLLEESGGAVATHLPLMAEDAPPHAAGQRVGPYRLLRLLGTGGMGEVWLAERADGLMQREVALKLPRADAGPAALAERMARERNILAALVHPHIARLYDAGLADDGQPYLALELVHGERIDLHAERLALDVPARVRLALQAARAVAHAHAQLVVHRDIKPSNLLVDEQGQVKLLDFGIAKLLDREDQPGVTERGLPRPMTPGYASPEQVAGQPVGTRSDLYSLAVVLYELLTGSSPYRPARDTRGALEDAVLLHEPRRPSDVATTPQRRRALRGGLDTIVLHALAKAPEQRYATVDAFAADLERHLEHRPLLARPESWATVFGKFVRRHRVAFGAGALTLAGIVGGAALALWQAREAQLERARAEQVKDFVVAILGDTGPYHGRDAAKLTTVDLVHRAEERLRTAKIDAPAVRVEVGAMIGESLLTLGDVDGAERVLKTAADESRALGDAPALQLRARMLAAQVHRQRGRPQQQADELLALRPLAQRLARSYPEAEVELLQHLTMSTFDRGDFAGAERLAAEVHGMALQRLGDSHPVTVAATIILGTAHRYAGHAQDARRVGEQALRLARAAYPGPDVHPRVIEAQSMYGRALADVGELGPGIVQIEAALAGALATLGPDAQLTSILRNNLASNLADHGRLEPAIEQAREALRHIAAVSAVESYNHAMAAAGLGYALLAAERDAEALAQLLPAARTLGRLIGPGHDFTLMAEASAVLALARSGRLAEARSAAQALPTRLGGAGVKPVTKARAALATATLLRREGRPAEALATLQPLLAEADPAPRVERERARARVEAGQAELARGRRAEAEALFRTALAELARLEAVPTPARAAAEAGLQQARTSP